MSDTHSVNAEDLLQLPLLQQHSVVAGLVIQRLSDKARTLVFGATPKQISQALATNPRFHGRILASGVKWGLAPPDFKLSEEEASFLAPGAVQEKATNHLALMLHLSRLKGVLDRNDIRALLKRTTEENLAYAWSRQDLWRPLAADSGLLHLDPADDVKTAQTAVEAASWPETAWWSTWIDRPANQWPVLQGVASQLLVSRSEPLPLAA